MRRAPAGRLSLVVTLVATLTAAPAVRAQAAAAPATPDRIGEVTLFGEEEIEIQVATKTATPLSKAPGAVTVVTAQQIRESSARSIPELLRLVAGVNVRWNPMVQTLDMRSFGQNPFTSRVLLLIDGVPYNDWNKGGFSQHPSFDFFVLQNIKRLEIIRGPGSSLYGENAYWGVVNIVTLSGDDLRGGRVELFAGDRDTGSLGAVYGNRVGDGQFLVSAKYLESQLPMRFWFDEQDSAVEASDVFFKAGWKGLQLSYYRHDDELDGYSRPIAGGTFDSADPFEQTVDIAALKYDWSAPSGKFSFGGDVSYATRDGQRCAGCHALPQRPEFADTVDHGHQLIGDFRFGFRPVASHDVLVGVEARQVDAGDHVDEFVDPATVPGGAVFEYEKVAAYVQDQISFADDRFRLIAGARYDGDNDLFDDEISPRLAFVWNPSDPLVLRGGWSTAFRFPTFTELYQASWFLNSDRPGAAPAIPLSVFRPNPALEPEEIRTFELGGEYRFTPALSGRLDLFRSEVENFMVVTFPRINNVSSVFIQNHPDEATITGGELELRWALRERISGFASFARQDNDQDGSLRDITGKPYEFVYAPENKVNFGTYLGPFAGFRATLEATWKDEAEAPSFWNELLNGAGSGVGTIDSYTLLNARLSYELPFSLGGASEPVRISIVGKDLLDEEPVETLIPFDLRLPGREIFGSVDFGF